MNVDLVFVLFALAAVLIFWRCRPAVAVLAVFLGGWLLLPVGHYPVGSANVGFPYWITGLAVPSDMLITKAWVAPVAALAGVLVFDRRVLGSWRPAWCDGPMLLWCLWPLLQSIVRSDAQPAGGVASLYLAGCFGAPWLLGRLYFSTPEGQRLVVQGLVVAGLACLPFALVEGVVGPLFYGLAYEAHPFRADGVDRYVGFRPLGFFENGNQYGLWVAICALAAAWLAGAVPQAPRARALRAAAAVTAGIALAAQSVGALALVALGAAFLSVTRLLRPRRLVAAGLVVTVLAATVYVSGALPILRIGKDTAVGQQVVNAFRAVGRGSFTWRISQDQQLLALAKAHVVVGTGQWDWWREKQVRPWGLAMLTLGQFGLVGVTLLFGALTWPAARAAWRAPRESAWRAGGLPLLLATVVGIAVVDALLNSFLFFPAVLAAGALALKQPSRDRPRGEVTRIRVRPA